MARGEPVQTLALGFRAATNALLGDRRIWPVHEFLSAFRSDHPDLGFDPLYCSWETVSSQAREASVNLDLIQDEWNDAEPVNAGLWHKSLVMSREASPDGGEVTRPSQEDPHIQEIDLDLNAFLEPGFLPALEVCTDNKSKTLLRGCLAAMFWVSDEFSRLVRTEPST